MAADLAAVPFWRYIPPGAQMVTDWSGGQTRELYLAPAGTSYAGCDFTLRLSSATVEVPESHFTHLPDYNRLLMPLVGTVKLQHDGGPVKTLPPLAVDAFSGGAATDSWGQCRDFNVMLRRGSGYRAAVKGYPTGREPLAIALCGHDFLYAAQGSYRWQAAGKQLLAEGGLLVLQRPGELQLLPQDETGLLVHVQLWREPVS